MATSIIRVMTTFHNISHDYIDNKSHDYIDNRSHDYIDNKSHDYSYNKSHNCSYMCHAAQLMKHISTYDSMITYCPSLPLPHYPSPQDIIFGRHRHGLTKTKFRLAYFRYNFVGLVNHHSNTDC